MSLEPVLIAPNTAITITGLEALAAAGKVLSPEFSLATINAMGLSLDIAITVAVAESKTVDVYLIGTNLAGSYGTTGGVANTRKIGAVDMSETTPKINIQIENLPPFFKLLFANNMTASTTGYTVTTTNKTINNV